LRYLPVSVRGHKGLCQSCQQKQRGSGRDGFKRRQPHLRRGEIVQKEQGVQKGEECSLNPRQQQQPSSADVCPWPLSLSRGWGAQFFAGLERVSSVAISRCIPPYFARYWEISIILRRAQYPITFNEHYRERHPHCTHTVNKCIPKRTTNSSRSTLKLPSLTSCRRHMTTGVCVQAHTETVCVLVCALVSENDAVHA